MEFRGLAMQWAREPELWIDTETADWRTAHSRISLLQVRTPDGRLCVVDVLAPEMREVLEAAFIPAVMAEPSIRKWAHNARYERRYLGGEQVRNLHCTVQLARSIPYHRLPTRKLTLAALASHLMGTTIDKTHQGDEWGVRPLTPDQLHYAAADPEWCYRVQQRLESTVVRFDAAAEDPAAIREDYGTVAGRLREREARRTDIREGVRDWLVAESQDTFGGFRLQRRVTVRTTLGDLVRVATEFDPGHTIEIDVPVIRKVLDALDARDRLALRSACLVRATRTFRGPRLDGREARLPYQIERDQGERVDGEYAAIDDERRRLASEKEELRQRLRAWLEYVSRTEWEGFCLSEPREYWSVDIRMLLTRVPGAIAHEFGVPSQYRLAFGAGVLDHLDATKRETAFVTWRERLATHLDREAPQSRDWHEAVADEEPC